MHRTILARYTPANRVLLRRPAYRCISLNVTGITRILLPRMPGRSPRRLSCCQHTPCCPILHDLRCECYFGSLVPKLNETSQYCMSVLLPEAVLQILLWRSGHRHTPEVLSAEEETRLHDLADQLAEKRYWVHDVIRLKRAVDRTTLPPCESEQSTASLSSRLRTRRR